jgi:serine protease Do
MFSIPAAVRALSLRKFAVFLASLGLLAAFPQTLPAQFEARDIPSKSSSRFLAAFREPVARACQSTVRVFCDGKRVALGTIVGADGWILTKASELNGTPVCYLSDDRQLPARVVGVHEAFDLALLKIDARGLKAVEWQDSKNAPVGSWLVSSSSGVEALAAGVVSVATRRLTPREAGPTKAPPGGFLGINMEASDDGPRITRLQPESPAARAGLKTDDCILSVDGKSTDRPEAVQHSLQQHKPGDTIRLKIKRGENELELQARLDKRPIPGFGDFSSTLGGKLSNRRTGFTTVLQHDSILRPEDCGGPLVDLEGKVVGINIARAARVETLAIPAEAVQSVLPDLMSGKLSPSEGPITVAAQDSKTEELTARPKVVKQNESKAEQEKTGTDAKKSGGK